MHGNVKENVSGRVVSHQAGLKRGIACGHGFIDLHGNVKENVSGRAVSHQAGLKGGVVCGRGFIYIYTEKGRERFQKKSVLTEEWSVVSHQWSPPSLYVAIKLPVCCR